MIAALVLAGLALAWWLVGILGVILIQLPDWLSGNDEVVLDRDGRMFALMGVFMLLAALMEILCSIIVYVVSHLPKLTLLPNQIVILKRRTMRRDDSTL